MDCCSPVLAFCLVRSRACSRVIEFRATLYFCVLHLSVFYESTHLQKFLTANANHGSNCIPFLVSIYRVFLFIVVLCTAAVTDFPTEAGLLCHEGVVLADMIKERLFITFEGGIMSKHVACIIV